MTPDLQELTERAVDAARQASDLVRAYLGRELAVTRKAGGSLASQVLTEVDCLSLDLILERLAPSIERYNLGVLAEEGAQDHSRFERPFFWCIDPIDGTLPFIEGGPGCSVSIALVSQAGEPLIGVVSDPCTQTLYRATAGQGAFRNDVPWEIPPPCSRLSVICDRSFLRHPDHARIMADLAEIATELGYEELELISHGGAVMNACWVIERAPACYIKAPRSDNSGGSIWDYAATACLFRELGAVCTDAFGRPLELNRRGSTYLNHRGLLFASDAELAARLPIQ
jgi:fructose-1,6-bisphosphatase/inositol monophosphatase family enzyme